MPARRRMSILQPVAEGSPETHFEIKVKVRHLYALGT